MSFSECTRPELRPLSFRPLIDSELPVKMHSTTVLAVRRGDETVMASDGQVTFGDTVVKKSARKIRRLYNDRILAGFAGSAADSFALFSRFEAGRTRERLAYGSDAPPARSHADRHGRARDLSAVGQR